MKNIIVWAILGAASLGTAACAPRVSLKTPPGFAVLEEQKEYAYRATSAEGVVIGVRTEKNEPKGNLEFWSEALDRQLRMSGYAPEADGADVRAAGGLSGRELRYVRKQSGRPHRLWIAVFVTDDRVWVVEAGGDADRFKEKQRKAIQKAIESIGVG
jgi:hypothetical protein